MLYLILYTDGTFVVFSQRQTLEMREAGAKIFGVSPELTVKDISDIMANDAFEVDDFIVRDAIKVRRLH